MKRSDITIERLRELFDYDPLTGKFYQKVSGRKGFKPGAEVGYLSGHGYVYLSVDGIMFAGHRAAWALHFGVWPETALDHKDRDKSNCRINNLRLATTSQNQANVVRPNATGRKGVRMCKGKYQAQVKHDGKYRHLGTFDTLDEASHAYNKAAIALHGEFAVLNPIGEDKAGDLSNTKEPQA